MIVNVAHKLVQHQRVKIFIYETRVWGRVQLLNLYQLFSVFEVDQMGLEEIPDVIDE